jgi:hypothetical protein
VAAAVLGGSCAPRMDAVGSCSWCRASCCPSARHTTKLQPGQQTLRQGFTALYLSRTELCLQSCNQVIACGSSAAPTGRAEHDSHTAQDMRDDVQLTQGQRRG